MTPTWRNAASHAIDDLSSVFLIVGLATAAYGFRDGRGWAGVGLVLIAISLVFCLLNHSEEIKSDYRRQREASK